MSRVIQNFKILSHYRLGDTWPPGATEEGNVTLVTEIQRHLNLGYELHGHIFLTNPTATAGVMPIFGQVMVQYKEDPPRRLLERIAMRIFQEDTHSHAPLTEMPYEQLVAEIDGHPSLQNFHERRI